MSSVSLNKTGHSSPPRFVLTATDRDVLAGWVRSSTTPHRVVRRSLILLLSGMQWSNARIAKELGISRTTVTAWKARFAQGGTQALRFDAPGRGRKAGRDRERVARVLETSRRQPPDGRRWTVRTLAKASGVSPATVHRVWQEHALGTLES